MKLAIIGSRNLTVEHLEQYLYPEVCEIVSGGAKGIDACAAQYAKEHGLTLTVFLPEYERYGKGAPLKRNQAILDYADAVLAFWDGRSRGTKWVIDRCAKMGKEVHVILLDCFENSVDKPAPK